MAEIFNSFSHRPRLFDPSSCIEKNKKDRSDSGKFRTPTKKCNAVNFIMI